MHLSVLHLLQRNTLQMALLTDERRSHVIFNYYNVTWIGGYGQGCAGNVDPGGVCVPAQAGFNAGWGRHFTALPGSMTTDIVNIDQKSATGIQGRFVYQTDPTHPIKGGCSNDPVTGQWSTLHVFHIIPSLFSFVGTVYSTF